jgi:hypothetical protein
MVDPAGAREHLLGERRAFVEGVLACADRVADGWAGDGTTDRTAVVDPFESFLERSGLAEASPALLAECVDRAGTTLSAPPVAAPPYVVVTSEGVVLRATLDGGRLVVTLRAFAVDRTGERPRYVRAASDPESAVSADFRAR